MEEVVHQLSLLIDNIIRINSTLDSMDSRFNGVESRIATVDEKVERQDKEFKLLLSIFNDIKRTVVSHESKSRDSGSTPK